MKKKWMGAGLVLASVGLLVGPLQSAEAATPKIKVHYIDVGQGDAIYIKMPSGEDIVMDGGNKGKGDELVAYLKKQKVGDIDDPKVVVTLKATQGLSGKELGEKKIELK